MKANYNRKRKRTKKVTDRKAETIWLACLAGYLLLRTASSAAALHGSDAVLPLSVAAAVVFSGTFLFFAWFYETRPPVAGGVVVSLFTLTGWSSLLPVPYKAALTYALLTATALIGYILWLALKMHRHYAVLLYAAAMNLFSLLLAVRNYVMANGNSPKFAVIGGIAGALVFTVGAYLLAAGKLKAFDMTASDKAFMLLGCLAVGFVFAFTALYHFNYLFDTSAPVMQTAVVTEKELSYGPRRPTEYVLTVSLGETELDVYVSETEYAAAAIGSSITLEQHGGALGESYCLLN